MELTRESEYWECVDQPSLVLRKMSIQQYPGYQHFKMTNEKGMFKVDVFISHMDLEMLKKGRLGQCPYRNSQYGTKRMKISE